MKTLLCPSMMCADFSSLSKEVESLNEAGVDIFHNDIMDGIFVPNFGMGLQDLKVIRSKTKKMVDVHLMIQSPSRYINLFSKLGIDIIYFHPEADSHPARIIDKIRSKNIKPGIAISPGTSIWTVEPLLGLVDYVLVMTVNPGFSGQKYLSYVDEKIKNLVNYKIKNKMDFTILVDGAVSPDKVKNLSVLGVDGFVLGTSSLFGKSESYKTIIQRLGECREGGLL